MSSLSLGLGLTSIPVLANRVPTWLRLVRDAESAAAAAGASLWYVPPESYAARATYGPFVNSDTTGGNPTVGSGLAGFLTDRRYSAGSGLGGAQNLLWPSTNFTSAQWTPNAAATDNGAGSDIDSTPTRRFTSSNFGGGWYNFFRTVSAGDVVTLNYYISRVSGARHFLCGCDSLGSSLASFNPADGTFSSGPATKGAVAVTGGWRVWITYTFASGGLINSSVYAGGSGSGSATYDVASWAHIGSTLQAYVLTTTAPNYGPGNHATQATTANKPVLVTAPGAAASALGFAAQSLDGSNDNLQTSLTLGTACTLIVGVRASAALKWGQCVGTFRNDTNVGIGINKTGAGALAVRGASSSFYAFGTYAANEAFVASYEIGAGTFAAYKNGTLGGSGSATLSASADSARIGNMPNGGDHDDSTYGLAFVAPSKITSDQRKAIERLAAYIVGATYAG